MSNVALQILLFVKIYETLVSEEEKKPHKNKFINELPFFFFGSIYNDVATLLPAGVDSGQFGEQPNNGGNGNGNTHHDDDGRMTFKIPNIGGQVITLAKRIIPFV